MRIEKLRLRNLNSLAGEWTVDFTHPAYAADSLFAITGPTGAGKSTILDAVSLGLYGRTPRLNKISKNENSILSVGAGDCLAEVTFATQKGRFRTCWTQRRARRSADGELQPPRHELVNADTGAVLETRIKDVLLRVEEVTGMDYERFSRSVLLPQGRFADFLTADPDERAPLLEQITGTEIYRDISVEVHRRARAGRDRLESLQNELAAFRLMTEEEEAAVAAEMAEKTLRRETAAADLAGGERSLAWLENLARLREQAVETAAKFARSREEDAAFQPCRKRLAQAEKALELAAAHSVLDLNRSELRREERALADCEASLAAFPDLPALRETLRKLEESAPFLEEKTRLLEENFQLASRVHSLDGARGHLRDGEPCPLCGAREHPLAFGNVPAPDEARLRLAEARKAQRGNADALAEARAHFVRLDAARERRAHLRDAVAARRAPLAAAEGTFAAEAAGKGFPDEAAYLAARLPEAERVSLRRRADALAAGLKELSTLEREIRTCLDAEIARALTADPAEVLAARVAALRAELSQLDRDTGACAERLRANADARERRRDRLAALEEQRRECVRWDRLHALIGSVFLLNIINKFNNV